jgi:adenosylmethionine-8-amino-7-oxononanoate aminotransferase
MAALELDAQNADERGVRCQRKLAEQGIIIDFNRPVSSLRFFPPYVVTQSQLDMMLEALDSALA